MRLIDADELFKDIKKRSTTKWSIWDAQGIYNMVNMQPTVEPKKGKWISTNERYGWCFKCSNCGWVDGYPFEDRHNFCPNCGAYMREE